MSVTPHPIWPGFHIIKYWIPDPQTGKPKWKYIRENFEGTREEALAQERHLRQIHVSTHQTSKNATWGDIADDFRERVRIHKSEGYLKNLDCALKNLRPHFGRYPVSHITETIVNQHKEKRKTSPRACNQEIDYLLIIINHGHRKKSCQLLPFKIEKISYQKRLPRPPSPVEYEAVMQSMAERKKQSRRSDEEFQMKQAMLDIMYDQGLRFVEVRHIEWENLNFFNDTIYLGRTKTGTDRLALLPPDARETLHRYHKHNGRKKTGYIFLNPRTNKPYVTLRKGLRENAALHGISLSGPHALRHAAGTDTYNATGDLKASQDLLGHKELRSTQIYTKVSTVRKLQNVKTMRQYREAVRNEAKKEREQKGTNENEEGATQTA